jgi:hypothetical protein
MKKDLIDKRRLTVMLTYRCNAQCKECGTFSSPHDKNEIGLGTALSSIDWAKECGMTQVIFTGGEATLRWDDLLTCLRHARALGLGTRLVTNAQWAHSMDAAADAMRALMAAGLNEINYSTGDEHIRFIPVAHILHAIAASVNADLPTVLMFELRAHSRQSPEELAAQIAVLAPAEKIEKYFTFLKSPWMPIRPQDVADYPDGLYTNAQNVAFRQGCSSALSDYVVQGTGQIAACCGLGMRAIPELQLGRADGGDGNRLAAAIREGEDDLFLYALHKVGPEKILAWAAQKDPSIQWENMYAHRCQACMRIYRDPKVRDVVAAHMHELMAEMIYGGYVLRKFKDMADAALAPAPAGDVVNFV